MSVAAAIVLTNFASNTATAPLLTPGVLSISTALRALLPALGLA